MLTKIALRGRFVTIALMLAIIIGGWFSLTKLQVELLPDIEFPAITISTFYPDASSQTVLDDVTIPIENALDGIPEITALTTTSAPSISQVIIQTSFGDDMVAIEADINQRIDKLSFPPGVTPEVARINPNAFPVIEMAITSDREFASLVSLVREQIVPALESIPGVFTASIPVGLEDGLSIARANGQPAVTLGILKEADANTIEVANAVEKLIDELRLTLPNDVQFTQISNEAPAIQESIDGLTEHVLLGSIFAIAVMFAFLLSVRPTLISSISIPVSVFAALIIMQLQGMSLNILTLGALAIAVGRVVDDSIVVIENIFRHIQMGESRKDAAINGAREVAGPITVATLTTVAVFAPLALVGGFIGVLFTPFALVVTYSLIASLIVALTIVPVLAYMFLSSSPKQTENMMERTYGRILNIALKKRWQTLVAAGVLGIIAITMVPFIPVNFISGADSGTLSIRLTIPDANDPDDVIEHLKAVETILGTMQDEGTVVAYSANYGGAGVFGSIVGANSANLQVNLSEDVDTDSIAAMLRSTLTIDGRLVTVATVDAGGPASSGLELILRGNDYNQLFDSANTYVELLSEIDGVVNVSHNGVDLREANGLSALVPIIRVDKLRAINISGAITSDNTGAVSIEVDRIENENPLPAGVELTTGGVFEDIDEAFQQMAIAMAISVVLVYLVMMIAQRSFIIPVIIVSAMPLAFIGAFIGLFITQRALGLPALMGLLMLIGLVVTNAIVLISFVEQLRARGMPMRQALIVGGRTRLRPILMTAFTTSFVMVPMALNIGAESGGIIGEELATVVIGGILTSTFLTLVVLPVIYSFLRKKGPKVNLEEQQDQPDYVAMESESIELSSAQ
ncbi:efflux RND transporter permease subunit [Dehalococcoides mccartyi]|nr:efflux RND transporter permease subunit [Dehalococcoides mccartyi]